MLRGRPVALLRSPCGCQMQCRPHQPGCHGVTFEPKLTATPDVPELHPRAVQRCPGGHGADPAIGMPLRFFSASALSAQAWPPSCLQDSHPCLWLQQQLRPSARRHAVSTAPTPPQGPCRHCPEQVGAHPPRVVLQRQRGAQVPHPAAAPSVPSGQNVHGVRQAPLHRTPPLGLWLADKHSSAFPPPPVCVPQEALKADLEGAPLEGRPASPHRCAARRTPKQSATPAAAHPAARSAR
mmetsp:Transcript_81783/g.142581  ORF Transcript_81783/g.142581 Transcript_81783/m.142581 type:complete len:238 (-) Transcript_81783:186-899(-)